MLSIHITCIVILQSKLVPNYYKLREGIGLTTGKKFTLSIFVKFLDGSHK